MKNIIVGITAFFLSSSAFAEQSLNCSNAEGTLRRTEQEVWGANPVSWLRNNQEIDVKKVEWNDAKKVVLDRTGRESLLVNEIFATEVTVHAIVGGDVVKRLTDFLICKSHKDNGQD